MNSTPSARPTPPRSRGWKIGRVAGAPVIVTPSWFLAAAVLTVVFTPWVQGLMPDLGTSAYLVAASFVIMLFASVFLHEVAHALVARARGQEVHELAITLWGGHTAYSGGMSRPVDGFLVAVVGPLTNIALATVFWLAFLARADNGLDVPDVLLIGGALSNAFVGVFNLLPGLPLDGGQILEAVVWAVSGSRATGTIAAGWVGRVIAVGVLLWGLLPLLRGTFPQTELIFYLLVAGFLWFGATSAIAGGRRREAISSLRAGSLADPVVTVPLGSTVAAALAARPAARPGEVSRRIVVVGYDDVPLAVLDDDAASSVPPEAREHTGVDAVSVPLVPKSAVGPDVSGQDLLRHLATSSGGARLVPVVEAGRVTGVLDLARVAMAVRRS
ncbi:site-2 protease family protein [Myceligenerans pegani]|uniref:Zinc metalloprotease n=1 Tax=Myceligenerans pegani TaxID=2776917 RepID=A0ABR9N0S3_9MICO|nr:site-2 protease family protein [Myceligenerans sp. TRM 65318]MBE1876881.1 site-2 protease family protein [Myceligenerans sp. TRM 65318]MBE3019152.1 site-2 protease family protein [Myceligenerans sp. TRM 65318]